MQQREEAYLNVGGKKKKDLDPEYEKYLRNMIV